VHFLRKGNYPLVRPEVLGLPSAIGRGEITFDRARGRLQDALRAGDEEQCRLILLNLYLGGHSPCEICDRIIAPAFHALGDHWQRGDLEVYQERRGCEICVRVLFELRAIQPTPGESAAYAMGATLEDDPYMLPTTMAELCLREAGWRAESHGSCVPAETLGAALRDRRPRLLWLSVSAIGSVPRFLEAYGRLYEIAAELGVAVVVGGRALSEDVRREMSYSSHGDSMRHLVSFADALRQSAGQTTAASGDPTAT
jgi:methanogenic corrinoid protein MtbC1